MCRLVRNSIPSDSQDWGRLCSTKAIFPRQDCGNSCGCRLLYRHSRLQTRVCVALGLSTSGKYAHLPLSRHCRESWHLCQIPCGNTAVSVNSIPSESQDWGWLCSTKAWPPRQDYGSNCGSRFPHGDNCSASGCGCVAFGKSTSGMYNPRMLSIQSRDNWHRSRKLSGNCDCLQRDQHRLHHRYRSMPLGAEESSS